MVSEITVAEIQTDEQMNRKREGSNLLTIWEMGTTCGRIQMDPGICFHLLSVSSQIQSACAVSMANCKAKNAVTPEVEGLAPRRRDIDDGIFAHIRILLCVCQGVIRTTVNKIDILPPLFNDELNIRVRRAKGLTKLPYKTRPWRYNNRRFLHPVRMVLESAANNQYDETR
jgi:hypothetical protein